MPCRGEAVITTPTIDLGIAGLQVPVHSHIAYFWETEEDLAEALGFLEVGLRGSDHGVVTGSRQDIERILDALDRRGLDVAGLQARRRLTVLERAPTAQKMLDEISTILETALASGASLVRLSGIVGWRRQAGPADAELFSYEARLTEIAEKLSCVVLCLHEVISATGPILWHGVLGTHPQTLVAGRLSGNHLFVPLETISSSDSAVAANLSKQQGEREAFRRESEILRAIFDNAPLMISFYDAEGRLLFANREWESIMGWSLEEARHTDILSETYPDAERRREVRDFMQRAEGRWEDFLTRTRDGRMIDTSWIRCALSDGTRLGFGLDVTERNRAKEASQQIARKVQALSEQEEAHLRLVINTIPAMAWSLLPDGTVDFVNQRWLEYTGLSWEEALEHAIRIVHPDDLPRVLKGWTVDMPAGNSSEDEMRFRRADGEYRWFLVRTVPLRDEHGNILKWYGTSTDIEDRKQAEEKLRATSEQLRALSARLQTAREDVSTRIAREVHDEVGQALAALGMDVAWLSKNLGRSGAKSTLAAKLHSMAGLVESTAHAVQRIASDLRPSLLDNLGLEAAVDWAVTGFQQRTGITCRLEELLDGEPIEPTRATAIFRILQEALTNIARHARASRVDVLLVRRHPDLCLVVEDNGVGIDDERIEDFRSLGLLGMRERARSFGGDVEIAHSARGGTVLTARIPI